jgi:hypothetical protein
METWYRVDKWTTKRSNFINPVEVEKSTDKTVWIRNERRTKLDRHAISSDYDSYFRTFAEAKEFALKRQSDKIESATNELIRRQADYAKIHDQVE